MTTFTTKKEATEYLNELVESGRLDGPFADGTYIQDSTYILNHGEYQRPDFKAVRYKDGWKIKRINYFYPGTYNATADGPVIFVEDGTHLDVIAQEEIS